MLNLTDDQREEFQQMAEDGEMDYAIQCGLCGEQITPYLRSTDFDRPGLINGPESYQTLLETHSLEHIVVIKSGADERLAVRGPFR